MQSTVIELVSFIRRYLAFYCPFIKSKTRSQPGDTNAPKGAEKSRTPGQISLCVFASVDEAVCEDMEGDSCRAAVCSELTSCSLFILLSRGPTRSWALPKRGRQTQACYMACRDKACFYDGFHSEWANRRGENGRPYVLIRVEALASSTVALLWVWSPSIQVPLLKTNGVK